ncbi:MAG: glycosyltransferase family 4 protein [Candidatus Dormibacteraeota bacterium]|nr:glycosyltransferase family 4 protein [Candidatus Dormibacteraeota bacterium]
MPKVRVAHVLPVYADEGVSLLGGGERYALNLAQHLSLECEVTLVSFGPKHIQGQIDGIEHVVLPSMGGPIDNPVPRNLFLWLRRFDLVHAHQLRTASTSMLTIACRAIGRPLVATDLGGGGRSLMYRLNLHRLVRRFVMISRFSLRLLPPSAQGRAAVVLGGVDVDRYRLNAAPREPRVVLVGRILPHKGINYLIEAAGEDIPVVVAGRLMDQAYYDHLQRISVGKKVRFVLDPSDDEVQKLYETSAVTVSASVYRDMNGGSWPNSELLGLTLLESMAVGTPVVCTDVGGMPEYVRDGATGFIVPPNDSVAMRSAIRRLLDEPGLAQRLGRAGHDHVQQYSWRSVAAQVNSEYERVLASRVR